MKCLILAAGYATRLYPLTENFPKPLLKVGEKPILDWLIDDLQQGGSIDEYIVISNHKFAGIFRRWAEGKICKVTVVDDGTETNETRLGAVKDIQFAVEERGITDDVLVMAGDNMLDFSLNGFVEFSKEKGTSCVMCHEENDPAKQRRTAIITIDEAGRITSCEEKPAEPKGNLAVPPFYYYREEDLAKIPQAMEEGCGYDAPGSFAAWLCGETVVHAMQMPGHRFDVGNLESYNLINSTYQGITIE